MFFSIPVTVQGQRSHVSFSSLGLFLWLFAETARLLRDTSSIFFVLIVTFEQVNVLMKAQMTSMTKSTIFFLINNSLIMK